jgi:predicted DNA-binding transcriptional regulator YafY
MPGHKTSHTQLERFRLIDSLLSSGETVSFDDILEKLRSILRDPALSESTLRRDFRYMKNELAAPLEYDAKKYGWHYTKAFKLPSEGFSEEEILSLHLMRRLLAQHSSEDSFYKTFDSILEKITPKDLSLPVRFYIPSRPKCVIEEGVSEKVLHALKNNFMLDFYYNSKWEPEERHRRIMPFQIVIDEGSLYLYGAKQSNNPNPRLFNLSKMASFVGWRSKTS